MKTTCMFTGIETQFHYLSQSMDKDNIKPKRTYVK